MIYEYDDKKADKVFLELHNRRGVPDIHFEAYWFACEAVYDQQNPEEVRDLADSSE